MAKGSDIIKIGFDYRASLEQFEKETNGVFDGISAKAGKQRISIQLDAKNDKVIEKIKELQKLKLDKFTFEFGESGLAEQLKTFDQLEKKINEIINLSKGITSAIPKADFGTKNKTEAYNQLKQMADIFKNFYGNEEAMHSKAGTDAAYAYYKAYEEALKKGVAESKLQKVTVDVDPTDSFFTAEKLVYDRMQQYDSKLHYGGTTDLSEELLSLEFRLSKFDEAYSKVRTNLGNAPITPEILKNIEEYVRYLEIAEAREKDRDSFGFSQDDIDSMKDMANMYLGFAMTDVIEENKKYVSSLNEVREEKEKTDEVLAHSSTSTINDSQFDELKADVVEIREELNGVKEKISLIDSDGFENIKSDVEKTTESVKELNTELTELKSKVGNKSNISSGNSTIKDVFQNDSDSSSTAIANEQVSAMEKVENATEQAAQAKQDFVAANENVQNSVADSKSPLQLEAELMQQIAKDARDAADAKKEFVEANKQVKNSADDSNGSVKKDKYKNRKKISEDEYTSRYSDFASIANKTLTDNGNAILGNSVSTELVNGLVRVSAKIKTVDGDWKTFSAKIDADGNMFEQRFNTITKGVNKLNSELENFGKDTVSTPKSDTQKSVDKALNQQISAWKKLESIREETEKTDPKNEKRIAELEEIKELYQKQYDEAKNILEVNQNLYNVEKQTEQLKQIQLETDAKISKYRANQKASTVSSFQSSIDSYQSKLTKYSNRPAEKQSVEYQSLLKGYQSQLAQLKNRFDELSKEEIISEDQINSFNKLKEQLDTTDLKFQNVFKGDDLISVKKEIDTITQYMSKNTRISSEAKDKLRGYIEELKTKGADANVKAIHAAFLDVCDVERDAKREGQRLLDVIKDKAWYGFATQVGTYFSFNDIINYAKEGIQTVRELDTALVEMRKVSDESASSLKRVQDASFDLANEVGTTALQIQNSIADFMRIGDSVEEAQKHALDANTLLQVSEFDNIEDATSALVSMSKAWDDIDTQHINDVLNILGNNMPIATDELASSLQRSAGTLATLGATIEEAAALTVAGNSILQDPDSVAAGEFCPNT